MPNVLHDECSPYLLQHADQPVDWQPWGEAAFDLARRENKLVFLSVGYSTCHWCHVMAHESFDDETIAGILNHHFVSVKVDREERPDIDAAYMSFVQASTGQGGWPMSVWLTPDGEPVFGGTYFPPEDRHGRPGFPRVCHELARLWRDDRDHMESQAKRMMGHLRQSQRQESTQNSDDEAFAAFLKRCRQMFDLEWGGFGGAPKFPRPVVLRTLMQLGERLGLENPDGMDVKAMVEGTLLAMTRGGIHDHLGGGFHRYSVDRYWHVPHYEKMLYDQGQLAMTYLEAWQMTGEASHRQVAEGIFDYLTGTMRDSGGAFHAAEDADSLPQHGAKHPREGAFWTWEAGEISQLLDPRTAAIFNAAYGVEADGNARPESDPHRELVGQNTLFRAKTDEELAMMFHALPEEIRDTLKDAKAILLAVREKRPKPHRDDKIVSAWNGLAIAAMARGGRVLDRDDLTTTATAAAGFIRRELWDESRLYRSFRGRRSEAHGFPIDYSCLIYGLIELHMASPDGGWLDWALALQDQFDRHCWDDPQSGYLMRPTLQGKLLMSIRDDYDGAEPSANHLAIENLLKLAELTGNEAYRSRARTMLDAGRSLLAEQVFAAPVLLSALDLAQRGPCVVHLPHDTPADLAKRLRESYWPRALFVPGESKEVIVCENQSCRPLDRNAD